MPRERGRQIVYFDGDNRNEDDLGPAIGTSVLLVVLLILLAGYLFLQSAYFYVQEVEIVGLSFLTSDEVRAAAALQPGMNFWRIEESAVARQLLLHPRIREARVTRQFPNSLRIWIAERTPVGLVPYTQGFLEVSESGTILQYHPVAPTHVALPFLTGLRLETAGDGLELPGQVMTGGGVQPAISVAERLGPGGRADIAQIHVEDDELVLYTVNGTPIYVGEPDLLEAKVQVLLGMLEDIHTNQLEVRYIDIRVPQEPVLKLSSE